MPRKLAVAFGTIGLVAGALMPGAPVQAQGVKAGVLTCNVSSGFGFIFGSSKSVNCSFSPPGGPPQHYVGSIDKFGVDRCMFESNFPVDKVSCSYVVLWNSFKRLTSGFSAAERAKLFHDTAARVYRLQRAA